MSDVLTYFIASFSGLFAIMNPISITPIFITITKDADYKAKKDVAFRSTMVSFIIVSTFVALGIYLFKFFGISAPAFKIFGGLLIAMVGLEMVQSKRPSTKTTKIKTGNDANNDEDIEFDLGQAISPLATPILAGPGTIVTAMNFVNPEEPITVVTTIVSFAVVSIITYIAFRSSDYIVDKIDDNVIQVISKVMGLIIGVIGTEMFVSGIKLAFNL